MATRMSGTTKDLRAAIANDIKAGLPAGFQWLETERRGDVFDVRTTDGDRFVGRVELAVYHAATRMGDEVEERATGTVSFEPTYEAGKMSNYKVTTGGQINVAGLVARIQTCANVVNARAKRRQVAEVQEAKDNALREALEADAPREFRVAVFEDVVSLQLSNLTPAQARLIMAAAKTALAVSPKA